MKLGKLTCAGILATSALFVAAPLASASPTGSSGYGGVREVVVIDGIQEVGELYKCWASVYSRDIEFDNQSSRDYLVYASHDCLGDPIATVAPGTTATHYGWSARAALY
ncbi:hypothetical protein ACFXNW_02625 [Nocardia sp. NPDC059180]|uniref:hypothetical protein n=1 Tax=Nocardia sp. NPDC059180 TaxID=3346761 RepID=UPI0036ACEEBA